MALAPKRRAASAEPADFTYRCPGCGELVDRRVINEVLAHHQHFGIPAIPHNGSSVTPPEIADGLSSACLRGASAARQRRRSRIFLPSRARAATATNPRLPRPRQSVSCTSGGEKQTSNAQHRTSNIERQSIRASWRVIARSAVEGQRCRATSSARSGAGLLARVGAADRQQSSASFPACRLPARSKLEACATFTAWRGRADGSPTVAESA
jgi:hypothetical protein